MRPRRTHDSVTTDAYRALAGTTPAEKLAPLGIVTGHRVDIRNLAEAAGKYGIGAYLFFDKQLARTTSLELVIHQFRDVPEFERPYVRVEVFLRFVKENDPSFERVMQEHPVMVEIVKVAELSTDPAVPALVYVTGLMPYTDELQL